MDHYIGTKRLKARAMTRGEYNEYRGWAMPPGEKGEDPGYLVEYLDGGKANDSRHAGYISWSPAEVFEKAYRTVSGLTFGEAIEALKQGLCVARQGWNGKGMWLVMNQVPADPEQLMFMGGKLLPHILMKTVQGDFVPWLASQTDVLAEDWEISE